MCYFFNIEVVNKFVYILHQKFTATNDNINWQASLECKIPLLPNNVGKKSVNDSGLTGGSWQVNLDILILKDKKFHNRKN